MFDKVGDTGVVGDRRAVGGGRTTCGSDFRHNLFRGLGGAAAAIHRAAEIVHHNFGATPREFERMGAPQPASRAGDDRHFAVESNCHDVLLPASSRRRLNARCARAEAFQPHACRLLDQRIEQSTPNDGGKNKQRGLQSMLERLPISPRPT